MERTSRLEVEYKLLPLCKTVLNVHIAVLQCIYKEKPFIDLENAWGFPRLNVAKLTNITRRKLFMLNSQRPNTLINIKALNEIRHYLHETMLMLDRGNFYMSLS